MERDQPALLTGCWLVFVLTRSVGAWRRGEKRDVLAVSVKIVAAFSVCLPHSHDLEAWCGIEDHLVHI